MQLYKVASCPSGIYLSAYGNLPSNEFCLSLDLAASSRCHNNQAFFWPSLDVNYHSAYRHSFMLASGDFASGLIWEYIGFAVDHNVHHIVVFNKLRVH